MEVEVRYCTTRQDVWSSTLYLLPRSPLPLSVGIVLPAVMTTWFAYWQWPALQTSLYLHSKHGWWLPAVFLSLLCIFFFSTLGELRAKLKRLYPELPGDLVSITRLAPEGLHDTRRKMNDGELVIEPMMVPWKIVRTIIWQEGDIYFLRRNGSNIVPRTAFDDKRESQQFYQQAVSLWNAARYGAPVPVEEAATWPPAPRPNS